MMVTLLWQGIPRDLQGWDTLVQASPPLTTIAIIVITIITTTIILISNPPAGAVSSVG